MLSATVDHFDPGAWSMVLITLVVTMALSG
jgi:hypothetical protein